MRMGFEWSVAQLKIVKTILDFWARLNWEPARYQEGTRSSWTLGYWKTSRHSVGAPSSWWTLPGVGEATSPAPLCLPLLSMFDLSSFSFSSSPPTPPHPAPQYPACCLYLLTQGFTSSQKEFLTNSGDRPASERGQHQEESLDRARGSLFLACPERQDCTSTVLGKLWGTMSRTQALSQRDWIWVLTSCVILGTSLHFLGPQLLYL